MKKIKFLLVIPFFILAGNKIYPQGVSVSATGGGPDPSAMIDVSSTTKGSLMPRMSSAKRDSIAIQCSCTPATGLLIFNTDCGNFNYYNGSAWVDMFGNTAAPVPSSPTPGSQTTSQTQIVWNWNTVNGVTGYKYNTVNNPSSATSTGGTTYTQTGLTCGTSYTLYVWAYNGCGNSPVDSLTQTTTGCCGSGHPITDSRDGNTYNTVLVGAQCWMAQNLNYGTFEDIPGSGSQPSGYKYCQDLNDNNDPTCAMGGLYEWANLMNGSAGCNGDSLNPACAQPVQGLCPSGWHVPSHYEWTLLEKTIGGSDAGSFPYDMTTTGFLGSNNEGGDMRVTPICGSLPCWETPNTGATNSSGLTALPAGRSNNGLGNAEEACYFWSSTQSGTSAWMRYLIYNNADDNRTTFPQSEGLSVRCVQN